MCSQMRLAAVLGLLNPLTGSTPGRLFQRATRRSAGQPAISSASSFRLAKKSKGWWLRRGGFLCGAKRRDVVSLSIVNVILNLLGATLCAVRTFITPK